MSKLWLPIVGTGIVVLIVAMVVVFAIGGSSGSSDQGAGHTATGNVSDASSATGSGSAAVKPPLEMVATRAASLPTIGPGWTPIGATPLSASELNPAYPCLPGAALPPALAGGEAQYTYELQANNVEHGHLGLTVRVMSTVAAAQARIAAQGEPRYAGCLPAFDDEQLQTADATDVVHRGIERLRGDGGVGGVRYRDQVDFAFQSRPQTYQFLRGYFAVGRYTATVILAGGREAQFDVMFDQVMKDLAHRFAAMPLDDRA